MIAVLVTRPEYNFACSNSCLRYPFAQLGAYSSAYLHGDTFESTICSSTENDRYIT